MVIRNQYEQPVGQVLADWQGALPPEKIVLHGRYCHLEPISAQHHGPQLYAAFEQALDQRDWTYLPAGPFATQHDYLDYLTHLEAIADPLHYAIVDSLTQSAIGSIALMRIDAINGVVEIGSVTYSPALKRTRIATEAVALLLTYLFDRLGFRRVEWKCDALNAPSRTAAERFGFTYEGLFRQALVVRGRNRDTAWFSIIDSEFPSLRGAYQEWLTPENFESLGKQKSKLSECLQRHRERSGVLPNY